MIVHNVDLAFLFPIHNEEKRIRKVIKFIKFANRNFKNHKFIFLLNKCNDETETIIKNEFLKYKKIIILKSKFKSRGSGINLAIKKVKCKFFAICAVDNAWSFDFYLKAYKKIKTSKAKVIFGSKSHPKSIVKRNILRSLISFLSIIFLKIIFQNNINFDCQCIKIFRSDIFFLKKLGNYNYFAETEFALNIEFYKLKKILIPVNVIKTNYSKLNFINLFQYCIEAIYFRFFRFKKK